MYLRLLTNGGGRRKIVKYSVLLAGFEELGPRNTLG